jgi:hypothetical protein
MYLEFGLNSGVDFLLYYVYFQTHLKKIYPNVYSLVAYLEGWTDGGKDTRTCVNKTTVPCFAQE